MTHDYKRHGTITLFAAPNVLTGSMISRYLPRYQATTPSSSSSCVPSTARCPQDYRST